MEFVLESMLAQMKNSGSASPIPAHLIAVEMNESERKRAFRRLMKRELVGHITGVDMSYIGKVMSSKAVDQYYITEYGLRILEETPWIKLNRASLNL